VHDIDLVPSLPMTRRRNAGRNDHQSLYFELSLIHNVQQKLPLTRNAQNPHPSPMITVRKALKHQIPRSLILSRPMQRPLPPQPQLQNSRRRNRRPHHRFLYTFSRNRCSPFLNRAVKEEETRSSYVSVSASVGTEVKVDFDRRRDKERFNRSAAEEMLVGVSA
jgi:hypothetical protein